jgi:hypothetical protein
LAIIVICEIQPYRWNLVAMAVKVPALIGGGAPCARVVTMASERVGDTGNHPVSPKRH